MRPRYRIVIDEGNPDLTVHEIAIVDEPAIEINFIYFNKEKKPLYFNDEKMILAGPLMTPDKMIYRYDDEMGEYDVYFQKDDILNARYNFKKFGLTAKFNIGHTDNKVNIVLLEDYILKAGDERVKEYGFENLPEGTWFGIAKVEDLDVWTSIKKGELRGFSVEGLFQLRQTFRSWRENNRLYFETYTDYPKAASENAQTALRWAEENGWGDCGTPVGKARANQLAKGEAISRDTIARMASFERHRQNSKRRLGEGCGRLMWLAWGGDEGIEWAQRKLEQIEKEEKMNQGFVVNPNPGEEKDAFIGRCIAVEKESGFDDEQAAAICYTKWEDYDAHVKLKEWLGGNPGKMEVIDRDKYDIVEHKDLDLSILDWVKPAELRYYYDAKPGAQFDVAGVVYDDRSRDFCKDLCNKTWGGPSPVGEPKTIYTVNEIKALQSKFDAFLYAGGKHCRHTWYVIVPKGPQKLNKEEESDILSIENKKTTENKMKRNIKSIQKFEIREKLEDGTEIYIESPTDDIVVGAEVEIKVASEGDTAENEMWEEAPDGQHTLSDGTKITTEDGVITEIQEGGETTEEDEDLAKKKYKMEISEEDMNTIMAALQPKFDEIMAMISELASKMANTEEETENEEDLQKGGEFSGKAKNALSQMEKILLVKEKFRIK